ncbi:MAG: aminopeptidase P N-terminal domain-containing protein [Nocardioidaceae bacterium]
MTRWCSSRERAGLDDDDRVERLPVASWSAARRERLAERFADERIVVPAGPLKPRANDTDYRFRADTAHVYLTGNQTSDAVLVMDAGEATLFFRPRHARTDEAFWRDGRYGEAWSGRRRSLSEAEEMFGIRCHHLYELPEVLRSGGPTRLHRGVDPDVDALVAPSDPATDTELATFLSGDAFGQGRLGDRAAARRSRLHHRRLRGLRAGVASSPQARRTLDRRHILAAGSRCGQRRRL